ncbi:MAG: type II toxin-antitoxin system VapC family toxin [Spirochaetota bacterium]
MMLDTSYIIDLLRERTSRPGRATAFLERHAAVKLRMPLFVLCELELGVARAGDPQSERHALETLSEYIEPVFPAVGFAPIYAGVVAGLLAAGTPIPVMDALIGTVALQHSEPIVTRDTEHFSRIDGLVVLDHRSG